VLAFGAPLWLVLAANAVAGAGLGFLNPILGAVIFERIPRPLIGRVNALIGSLSWAGIPFGGLVGGALVALVGLAPGLLVCGTVYFLVTTLPGLRREWREMDEARLGSGPV
jgi:MFS family permease